MLAKRPKAVEGGVVVGRVVMEQRQTTGARLACDVHGVGQGAVAPMGLDREFRVCVLGIVDQEVGAVAQFEDAVGDAPAHRAVLSGSLVIADVGDRDRRPSSTR